MYCPEIKITFCAIFKNSIKYWKYRKSIAMLNIVRYNGNIKKAHKELKNNVKLCAYCKARNGRDETAN